MISCPAAKQMRCVNPSMATVSPSRTRSATASRIDVTLPPSAMAAATSGLDRLAARRDRVLRPAEDAELVPLGVLQDDPRGLGPAEPLQHRRPEALDPLDLLVPGPARPEVEVQPVLPRLLLGHL